MVDDVARAFFEARMRGTVCVELPMEADTGEHERGQAVGLLEISQPVRNKGRRSEIPGGGEEIHGTSRV